MILWCWRKDRTFFTAGAVGDMTNKCGSDGRPPLGVSGGPSTLHAMVQHGFLNEGCTTRYSWLAQFQGYKPLMYGIKPDYVRSVTKNGTSKCIAAPNLNIQLSISLDYKKTLKITSIFMTLEMTPSDKFSDDPWWSPYWAETWSHMIPCTHQPSTKHHDHHVFQWKIPLHFGWKS